MDTKQTVALNQEKLVEIAKAAGFSFLALFGSVARGEATAESDVDLAVRFGRTIDLFDLATAKLAMEQVIGRPVDLIPVDSAYPFVREAMMRDWIILYEPSPLTPAYPGGVPNVV